MRGCGGLGSGFGVVYSGNSDSCLDLAVLVWVQLHSLANCLPLHKVCFGLGDADNIGHFWMPWVAFGSLAMGHFDNLSSLGGCRA